MDEELKLKNLLLYQQALLDNQNNSNELIIVPLYKEDGTMGFKLMPNKKEEMELGANDPLFLGLTAGTQAGKLALKGAYDLGVKGFTKLQPYLNIMSPGTKEFMAMLNSGIPGKIASGAVTAAEGYWINEAIKQAKENPNIGNIAMAGLSVLPYANGVIGTVANATANGYMNLAKSYKPVRDLTMKATVAWDNLLDNISQISLNIKKAGVKFDKWWNADKRIKEIIRKIEKHPEFYASKAKDADRKLQTIKQDLWANRLVRPSLKIQYNHLKDFYTLPEDIVVSDKINPNIELPYKTFYIDRLSRPVNKSGERIDLSKLSEENLIRLLISRKLQRDFHPEFRISLDSHVGKTEMDEFLKLFKLGKNEKGDYILISNDGVDVAAKHPYTPEQFVDTQYSLGSFSDPNKPLLNGEIKFGGGAEGVSRIENPSLNLVTLDLNKVNTLLDPNLLPNKLIYLDPEYRKLFAENMAYVEQKIPGFVPYGSSVGLVDVGLPHSAGDIDGYMKASDWESFLKKNPGLKFEDKGDLKSIVFNEQMGKNGIVDINLVHSDKDGYVSGERGILLARMFFPEIYSEWNLFGRKGPLKVKLDDVMKAASEQRAAKTIADSFEINPLGYRKEKHLGRPFVYLSSGDPEQVAKGLELYGKSFGFTSGFPVTLDELTDIERNKKILRDLKMPVSIEEVASNPQKMKNTLTYWYMTNTIRGRGTNREAPQIIKNSLTQQWNPNTNRGGVVNGIGRNSVVFGDSRVGPMYGFILLSPNTPLTGSVEDKIKLVKRFTGMWDYEFTPEEITQMQNIGKRFGLNFSEWQLRNSERILDSTPGSESGALFFNALSKEMGINALTRSTDHGKSLYSSILEDSSNKPLIIYDTNAPESNPINLFNLFKRIEKLLGVTPGPLENIYQKLLGMTFNFRGKRVGPGKYERYIELDTPLDIKIPRERIIKTRLKNSGLFEKYLKALDDAENEYMINLNEEKQLIDKQSEAKNEYHKFRNLTKSVPLTWSGRKYNFYRTEDKIKNRKNATIYTPIALTGSAAAGYGIKTLVDNRNETMDELYKKGLKHNPTDYLILKYKAESAAALKGRIVSKRLAKLIKQELESRGVTNLE